MPWIVYTHIQRPLTPDLPACLVTSTCSARNRSCTVATYSADRTTERLPGTYSTTPDANPIPTNLKLGHIRFQVDDGEYSVLQQCELGGRPPSQSLATTSVRMTNGAWGDRNNIVRKAQKSPQHEQQQLETPECITQLTSRTTAIMSVCLHWYEKHFSFQKTFSEES